MTDEEIKAYIDSRLTDSDYCVELEDIEDEELIPDMMFVVTGGQNNQGSGSRVSMTEVIQSISTSAVLGSDGKLQFYYDTDAGGTIPLFYADLSALAISQETLDTIFPISSSSSS